MLPAVGCDRASAGGTPVTLCSVTGQRERGMCAVAPSHGDQASAEPCSVPGDSPGGQHPCVHSPLLLVVAGLASTCPPPPGVLKGVRKGLEKRNGRAVALRASRSEKSTLAGRSAGRKGVSPAGRTGEARWKARIRQGSPSAWLPPRTCSVMPGWAFSDQRTC